MSSNSDAVGDTSVVIAIPMRVFVVRMSNNSDAVDSIVCMPRRNVQQCPAILMQGLVVGMSRKSDAMLMRVFDVGMSSKFNAIDPIEKIDTATRS